MERRSGFTLIELLVVIAIIAILAAILFPVFAAARASARQTSCLSNTKQLNLAMMQYIQDYDERFPGWQYGLRTTEDSGSYWTNAIYPYVKNTGVYRCPDDVLEWTNPEDWTKLGPDGGAHDIFRNMGDYYWSKPNNPNYVSYGFNEVLGYGGGNQGGRQLGAIGRPAEFSDLAESVPSLYSPWEDSTRNPDWIVPRVAFAADSRGCCLMWENDRLLPNDYVTGAGTSWGPYSLAMLDASTRHRGGLNVAYADGHNKWIRWTKASWGNLSPFNN